jgi:hypothetical protein
MLETMLIAVPCAVWEIIAEDIISWSLMRSERDNGCEVEGKQRGSGYRVNAEQNTMQANRTIREERWSAALGVYKLYGQYSRVKLNVSTTFDG